MGSQQARAGDNLQLLLLFKRGKLQLKKTRINTADVKADARCGAGNAVICHQSAHLPARGDRLLPKPPLHAKLTQAFFINSDDPGRQFDLLNGQIHLRDPLFQRGEALFIIPHQ